MNLKNLLTFFFLVFSSTAFTQKEWSNWYFNGNSNLTFRNNNTPQVETNFVNPIPTGGFSYGHSYLAGTSYSDKITGRVKFILSSKLVYDRNYNALTTADFLRVCPGDTYSYHIIPFTNDTSKFYIIQFQSISADLLAQESGLQVRCPNAIGLGYSILDLSLNNGLGGFISANNVLQTGLPERIALVGHANGQDTWIIVHNWGDNTFRSYLVTDAGIAPPINTTIGPVINGNFSTSQGNMSVSHDGKTVVAQQSTKNYFEFYDFNNATGILSNYRTVPVARPGGRLIFSADDTKLYFFAGSPSSALYQLNLKAADIQNSLFKIADNINASYYDMQLGLDGKIYISRFYEIDSNYHERNYLSVIQCPNLPEYAANFKLRGIEIQGGNYPSYRNDYIRQPQASPVTKFSIGNDTAICFGQHTLSAPVGWQTYRWNTGDTTRQIIIDKPGIYYVLAGSSGFNCPSAYGSVKIARTGSTLDLGNDTTLCPRTSLTLHIPNNFNNIRWNDGTSNRNKIVTTSNTYSVKAHDQNGCASWDTIRVGFYFDPRANFGNDTTLCNNQTLLLHLYPKTSQASYLWQDGSLKDTFRVRQAGTYYGRVTSGGCTVSDTIVVNYVNAQDVHLGNDTTLCAGDSLLLQSNVVGVKYRWNTGDTTSSIIVKTSGTYWLRVNNGSCTGTDTIVVNFQPKPQFSLGTDTALCDFQKLTLRTGIPGASHLWQDNTTRDSLVVTQAGTYWARVTRQGCSVTDTIKVAYKQLPPLNLGRDTGICVNSSLVLDAFDPSIASYLWQNLTNQSTHVVNTGGTYFVKVVGLNGCVNADTIAVTINPLPVFTLGNDTTLCEQEQLDIALSVPGASFYWSSGQQSNSVTLNQQGVYWVDVSIRGCIKRDSIMLNYKPLPMVNLGNDTIICETTPWTLNVANANATYLWNTGSTNEFIDVQQPGKYFVRVNLNGCFKSDTVVIGYIYKPVFTLGNDTLLCKGQQIVLNPRLQNVSYLWQDGSTAPVYVVSAGGIYKLSATNNCGTSTKQVVVTSSLCKLFMPTAFTPNGDGLNSIFRVKYPQFIKTFQMKIFNRWGQMVYQSTNPMQGWDGKYQGKEQPQGGYIWQISYVDIEGNPETVHGNVVLIR